MIYNTRHKLIIYDIVCRRTLDGSALVPDLLRAQSMGLYLPFSKPYNSQLVHTTRCSLCPTNPKAFFFFSQALSKEITP